jgi:hypothetical protein
MVADRSLRASGNELLNNRVLRRLDLIRRCQGQDSSLMQHGDFLDELEYGRYLMGYQNSGKSEALV